MEVAPFRLTRIFLGQSSAMTNDTNLRPIGVVMPPLFLGTTSHMKALGASVGHDDDTRLERFARLGLRILSFFNESYIRHGESYPIA